MDTAHIRKVGERAEQIFTPAQVEAAVDRVAAEINAELSETNPLVLCTLIGGIVPTGLLLPRLNFPLQLDYIHATRYQGETTGSDLHWKASPCAAIEGRTVLIIDDVLDHGITLQAIIRDCEAQGAARVYSMVLIEKTLPERKGVDKADFTGLVTDDRYLFGYGMDYNEYLRNAPGIFAADEQDA